MRLQAIIAIVILASVLVNAQYTLVQQTFSNYLMKYTCITSPCTLYFHPDMGYSCEEGDDDCMNTLKLYPVSKVDFKYYIVGSLELPEGNNVLFHTADVMGGRSTFERGNYNLVSCGEYTARTTLPFVIPEGSDRGTYPFIYIGGSLKEFTPPCDALSKTGLYQIYSMEIVDRGGEPKYIIDGKSRFTMYGRTFRPNCRFEADAKTMRVTGRSCEDIMLYPGYNLHVGSSILDINTPILIDSNGNLKTTWGEPIVAPSNVIGGLSGINSFKITSGSGGVVVYEVASTESAFVGYSTVTTTIGANGVVLNQQRFYNFQFF